MGTSSKFRSVFGATVLILLSMSASMTISTSARAQTQNLTSQIDQSLGVKRIAILPLVDNVGGIYAKPLTERLVEILGRDRRFEVTTLETQKITPENLEDEATAAKKLLAQAKSDALLVGRITKGPQGLNMRLSLIGGTDMLPLTQERLENYPGFDLADMKSQTDLLMKGLLARLPYQAQITSRQGQLVTLNAGSLHGLRVGDEVYAILITGVTRHPKFKFITKVDREIMGKVKLAKVDESVSFGSLVSERTANLIQSGFKVTWSDMINYPAGGLTQGGDLVPKLSEDADAGVAYGQNPREWKSGPDASFGKLALLAGLGQTTLSSTNTNATSASGRNNFSPTVRIDAEMWLDPKWQFNLTVEQLAAKISNNLTGGSSPDPLNLQMQDLALAVGYNFLSEENNFWGPKFTLLGGFSRFSIKIDDSVPTAHTSKEFSSVAIGLGGSFPVITQEGGHYLLGGKFLYHLNPRLNETPSSSGSATPTLTQFDFYGEYTLRKNLSLRGDLNFAQASANFSGGTGTSASANFVTLLGGVVFAF